MTDPAAFPANSQQRVIRVFVSSTFRDMQAEREELVKRVFPKLRKLCAQRGVIWGDVDLRRGITEEQAHRGEVLPICLAEIDRCRPYFLGLLGERYGWVPESLDPDLLAVQPWLAEHRDRSVTELEIQHGVLHNPGMAGRAFFYFRSPSYLDALPPEQHGAFREVATPGEIDRWGPAEAARRAEERRRKLTDLKGSIRASGLPVREDYADPQALAELVLKDMTALIEELFPEGSQPDPLDKEAAEHEAFARSRLGVYIGRPEYFQQLDEFARGPSQDAQGVGLVVRGESGSGKSALLANWLAGYHAAQPADVVLYHAIGATPQSSDGSAMLRRLLAEFRRRLDVQVEVPNSPVELQRTFAGALHQAAARARVVLVLDALNQLEDRDGMPDLFWLPPELPANVRLIASTLPGRSLKELTKRRWPVLDVQPLEPAERIRLIVECLRQASKALSEDRVQRIASAEQAANPLFLRALLEELRVFGVHEKLDDRVAYYLGASSLEELFARILERYEADYERERPGLVGEAMTLLWAARRGLAENELLQLLGGEPDGEPLPQAYWSPLYLAAEHSLTNRGGLICFFHDYVRRAAQCRYLPDAADQAGAHRRLAVYFHSQPDSVRRTDELAWQWQHAGAWEQLKDCLAEFPIFMGLLRPGRIYEFGRIYELLGYWLALRGRYEMRAVYRA